MVKENFTSLQLQIKGKMVLPHDAEYDTARRVHNGMIDKRPLVIVYCNDVEDVKACINFAREKKILLAVRCGGHNAAGFGVTDDALVVDLSLLKSIRVDAEAKTVTVGGGCLLKEVDAATHEKGMAVPLGFFGGTGVGGLTLGGGLGYLTRQYGLTIDSLMEAEVVLADGRLVKASSSENPDLYWALKGGGGNFGVVVSFIFRLHPVDNIYGGVMLWNWEDGKEMMSWYDQYINSAPDDVYGLVALLIVPPGDPFPQHLHNKKMCGMIWCYNGNMERAEKVFAEIRAFKTPVLDLTGQMPFTIIQTMFDEMYPPGMQWYWKALFVNDLDDTAIDVYIKHAEKMPSLLSTMHIYPLNGAAAKVGKYETAWNYREAKYSVVIIGIDPEESGKEKIIKWTRDYFNALQPYSLGGGYINFTMDEGNDYVKSIYGENYKRLAEVKAKYDPGNLFRVNQNIKPA